MIKINLITVGRLKEKYWRDAAAEYAKRLSAYCNLEIIELNEYALPENPSDKQKLLALEKEACAMGKYLDANGVYNIAMCIEGKQLTSEELSAKMDSCGVSGYSVINFIIGSSYGISQSVKQRCALRLSMSKMTFPHQLARILLLEQIYRGFQISNHTKYHK